MWSVHRATISGVRVTGTVLLTEPLLPVQRSDLLELMDDKYGKNGTMVISQQLTDEWHSCVGNNKQADAILGRLIHNSHLLKIKGEPMRKRLAQVD